MFTGMKRCASREKDLIIEAQKKQIDSLHSESHELRRQRDQLLQRLQRAETKKTVGRFNVNIKKSRSLSSHSPANCGNGPKVSLSDYCLAEKVKVSHAASRRIGRSALLAASSCEVAASVHQEAASTAAVRTSEPSSVGACSSGSTSRQQQELRAAASARRREQHSGGGGGQKRAASHSPSRHSAVATAAQRRLAAEIIQYQYRQHALSKSFERLRSRGGSSGSGRQGGDRTEPATGGWCSPPPVPAVAETVDRSAAGSCGGGGNRAATHEAAWAKDSTALRWNPASTCEGECSAAPEHGPCRHRPVAGRSFDSNVPVASVAKAGPFPCAADCAAACRGVDGPSALCEKELEAVDTSLFEASYMSAAADGAYSIPPSPYDNVSAADGELRCSDSLAASGPASVGGLASVASRWPDQPPRPGQQCRSREAVVDSVAAARRSAADGGRDDDDSIVDGELLRLCGLSPPSSPRRACSLSAAHAYQARGVGCRPPSELQRPPPLLHFDWDDADDCRCRPRGPSPPTTRSSTGAAAAAAADRAVLRSAARQRQPSTGSANALSCRSVVAPSTSLHSAAAVLWPGGGGGHAAAAAAAAEKERKRQYRIGLNLFNKKPEQGIDYLVERHFLERTPRSVAHFLLTRKGISKQLVGDYLGNLMEPFNQEVLRSFVNQLDFKGLELDAAVRIFIVLFRLPGEAQKIERIVEVFSQRYSACNPAFALRFRSADTVFLLAFAIILLNTDLHNPNIKPARRMPLESFINNLKGVDSGFDVDRVLLAGIYDRIQRDELKPGSDHTNQVRKVEETIVEKRCAVPKLAVPFRRLVCYCRLYEVREPSKKGRAGTHQREVFLFNDILVVTKIFSKKKKNITSYSFRASYPLIDLKASAFETEHHPYGIRLAVAADNRSLTFFNARNSHDREKFVDDLRESIQEMNEMETVRLEMAAAACHGGPGCGSSAAATGPVTHPTPPAAAGQPQAARGSATSAAMAADRCSKDSGVVVCVAGPAAARASPQLLLPPSDLDACCCGGGGVPALGAAACAAHHCAAATAAVPRSAPDCGRRQQQQQCAGSDVDHDEIEKRHSSGSIDSGVISTSTGSVAEAMHDEGSPRQPARTGGGSSSGCREGAQWVPPSAAIQQHVQPAGLAVTDRSSAAINAELDARRGSTKPDAV